MAMALSGFILVLESPWKSGPSTTPIQQTLLPGSQVGSWDFLRIQSDASELVFRRDDTRWHMIHPLEDLAHPTLVTGLIESLSNLVPRTILTESMVLGEGGWSTFGLEPAKIRITLGQGERMVPLGLGDREPVGNKVYVRVADEREALVVDAAWMDTLPDDVKRWRDPRILSADLNNVDRIEVHQVDGSIVLRRHPDHGGWYLAKPASLQDARANLYRIETLLTKVLPAWHTTDFLSPEEAGALKWMGLEDPVLKFSIHSADQPIARLAFGFLVPDQPGLRYARVEGRAAILLAPDPIFQQHLNIPVTAFRDPFLIDPAYSFNRLQLGRDDIFSLLLDVKAGRWKVEQPIALPVDETLVRQFFQRLANLQVKAFHDNVPDGQIQSMFSSGTYKMNFSTVRENAVESALEITLSRPFGEAIYAMRSNEATVYEMPASLLLDLPGNVIELRDRLLWNVSKEDIVRVEVAEGATKWTLERAAKGIWMLEGEILESERKQYTEAFIDALSRPTASKWVEAGDGRYTQFGIGAPGNSLQLTIYFQRDLASSVKRIGFGRQSPRSDIYAGVELETGPLICELPAALPQAMREILSWKKPSNLQ